MSPTGSVDVTVRLALFAAYFEAAESPCSSAKDFDTIDSRAFAGCSEFNLVEDIQGACEANRRVAVLLLKVSKNFPINYPCKQGAIPPCQNQAKSSDNRRTPGFRCKFYDGLVEEKSLGDSGDGEHQQAIEYEPTLSTVCGTIFRRTFEIECDDGNDMCVQGTDIRWILRLTEAASLEARFEDSTHYPAVKGIEEIQVNVSPTDSGDLTEGSEVVLKGYLSHGHSPFHHLPVQLALVESTSPSSGGSVA